MPSDYDYLKKGPEHHGDIPSDYSHVISEVMTMPIDYAYSVNATRPSCGYPY